MTKEPKNELRYKMAVRFVVEGDLRFISHHDMMRLFERALSRAQLPVSYSGGFNPRPRLSLPVPRPVGVASEVEILVIELSEPVAPGALLDRLANQMPFGLILAGASVVDRRRMPRIECVDYALTIPPENAAAVADALSRLLAAETWRIQRSGRHTKPAKTIDLRAYLADASLSEGTLRWRIRVTQSGSVRPAEFLLALGLDPNGWQHRVRRTSMEWQSEAPARTSCDPTCSTPS